MSTRGVKAFLRGGLTSHSTGLAINRSFIFEVDCSPVNSGVMRLPLMKGQSNMKPIVRALFLICFLILGGNVAYSCTCLQISHRKEFRQANAIFVGQVIEIAEDKTYVPPKLNVSPNIQKTVDSTKQYIVRFKVERKFKGARGKEITLYTFQSDSPCSGIAYTKGERYLVYADRKGYGLTDGGLCSRTQKLDEASKEYRELNSSWFWFRSRLPFRS